MVESAAEVLVKEERRPEAISAAVHPPIFLLCIYFFIFDLHLRPSRNKIPGDIYKHF
jgi:hypothetical protein